MGGQSETSTSVLNEALSNSIVNISQACTGNAANNLNLTIGQDCAGGTINVTGKVTQIAQSSINCAQSADVEAAMQAELATALQSSSSTTSNNLFSGDIGIYSQSNDRASLTNREVLNATLNAYVQCANAAVNNYTKTVTQDCHGGTGGVINFGQEIYQEATNEIPKCVQSTLDRSNAMDNLSNRLQQRSTETDLAGTLFGSLANILSSVFILCLVFAIIAAIGFVIQRVAQKRKATGGAKAATAGKPGGTATAAKAVGAQYASILRDLHSQLPEGFTGDVNQSLNHLTRHLV